MWSLVDTTNYVADSFLEHGNTFEIQSVDIQTFIQVKVDDYRPFTRDHNVTNHLTPQHNVLPVEKIIRPTKLVDQLPK